MKISRIGIVAVVVSASLLALGFAYGGKSGSDTLRGNGCGGHGFGQGCDAQQAGDCGHSSASLGHRGRGNGQGQRRGQGHGRFAGLSQNNGGCNSAGGNSKGHGRGQVAQSQRHGCGQGQSHAQAGQCKGNGCQVSLASVNSKCSRQNHNCSSSNSCDSCTGHKSAQDGEGAVVFIRRLTRPKVVAPTSSQADAAVAAILLIASDSPPTTVSP